MINQESAYFLAQELPARAGFSIDRDLRHCRSWLSSRLVILQSSQALRRLKALRPMTDASVARQKAPCHEHISFRFSRHIEPCLITRDKK